MSTWNILERYLRRHQTLREARQYRAGLKTGQQARLKDLSELAGKADGSPQLNPSGGILMFSAGHPFIPKIWGGWQSSLGSALVLAASDKSKQHLGAPQGGMVFKQNWGGRVVNQPGKPRSADFEDKPSAMDLYDVVMEGEISKRTTKKGDEVEDGNLFKLAYSPAIGNFEERKANLVSLLNGGSNSVKRRPQAEVPGPKRPQTDAEFKLKSAEHDAMLKRHGLQDQPSTEVPDAALPTHDIDGEDDKLKLTPHSGFRTGKGHDPNHRSPEWMRANRSGKKRED